jgi:hypothetical protein
VRESHSSHSKSSGGGGGEEDAEEDVAMDLKHFGGDMNERREGVSRNMDLFFCGRMGW